MSKCTAVVLILILGNPTAWGQANPAVVRKDYDMRKLAAESQLSQPELAGRRLFVQRCANCHDPLTAAVAQESVGAPTLGPPLDRERIKNLGDAATRLVIANGSERMPGFQYALTPIQVGQILAFLNTVEPTPSPAVTPAAAAAPAAATSLPDKIATPAIVSRNPNLWGTVHAVDGKALSGASVSARNIGSTITTSVYTDEHGDYFFPRLGAGVYTVWAQRIGFDTSPAQVHVDQGSRQLFRLNPLKDYSEQLRGSDWLAFLPERTPDERHMKELIRVNCMECHALSVALHQRFDEAGWLAILNLMEHSAYAGWLGPPHDNNSDDVGNEHSGVGEAVIRRHKIALAHYLASVRGPTFLPSSLKTQPPPSGESARVVVTEYDVPVDVSGELNWYSGEDRSQGPASANHGGAAVVHDVMADNDGNPWFTSVAGGPDRSIAKIDARTGDVTDFKVIGRHGETEWTHCITKDAGGNLWVDGDGLLLRVDPRTNAMQIYRGPAGLGTGPRITTDIDLKGNVWSATRYGAVRLNPTTQHWLLFGNVTLGDGFSYGMSADGDGRGWWTQFEADRVEMGDPETGRTTEYRMTLDESRASVATTEDKAYYDSIGALEWGGINSVPGAQAPRRLGADKAAHVVWVPNYLGLNLARIDTQTGAITYVPMPIPATPYFVTVDQHHDVWMNTLSDDAVFRYRPATQEWAIFSLPSLGCDSRHVSLDEARGDVWIACARSARVGRFHFRSPEELQAARDAAIRSSQRPTG